MVAPILMSQGTTRNTQLERSWRSHPPRLSTLSSDHLDFVPKLGRYPLIVSPIVKDVKLNRVLVDGGNSRNILFLKTFNQMGLSRSLLCPSRAPLHGIVTGTVATPVG
jgi:hypothetical protein